MTRARIRVEILVVLAVTFGASGLRSLLRLVDDLLSPTALNDQAVSLNAPQAQGIWLDLALQLVSAGVLFSWGGLALYLLSGSGIRIGRIRWSDLGWGAGLAALIGLPGLIFYASAVHLGLSKQVIPTTLDSPWWEIPILLVWLRGSYHLYQGVSAGFGNIIMGVIFAWFYHRTGRVWPLVIAHFLIDAVAFVGYTALGGDLSWLGL